MTKHDNLPFRTILVINTTARDQTSVALINDDKTRQIEKTVRAQDVQLLTEQLLSQTALKLEDIEAVAVLNGPGSYTGTRIGIAAANTLGWWLNKPVLEVDGDSLPEAINQLKAGQFKQVTTAQARY